VPSLRLRRRVVADGITFVGLDVHNAGIVVAVAEGVLRGEVREYGRIANTSAALGRLAGKLGDREFGFASVTKPDRAAIALNAICYSRPSHRATIVLFRCSSVIVTSTVRRLPDGWREILADKGYPAEPDAETLCLFDSGRVSDRGRC
jgi:hypothetical protein